MAALKPEEQRNTRKMAVQFTPTNYERLAKFARVTGKSPAAAAREIILEYLDTHEGDVAELEKAAAAYKTALKALNARGTISLFPELEKGQEVM